MALQPPVQLDRVFHARTDPTRRAMLHDLGAGERNASELAAPHRMSFPAARKHVRVLEAAGLVRLRIVGRPHRCRIEPMPLAAAGEWLRFYERLWPERLDALDALLRGEDAGPAPAADP